MATAVVTNGSDVQRIEGDMRARPLRLGMNPQDRNLLPPSESIRQENQQKMELHEQSNATMINGNGIRPVNSFEPALARYLISHESC